MEKTRQKVIKAFLNQMVIIDTDSGEQIVPVIERSIDNTMYKMGKYKLLKGKRYIVMEFRLSGRCPVI